MIQKYEKYKNPYLRRFLGPIFGFFSNNRLDNIEAAINERKRNTKGTMPRMNVTKTIVIC